MPPKRKVYFRAAVLAATMGAILSGSRVCAEAGEARRGWLSWRGPEQCGVSRETGLPEKVSMQDALWVADFPGQSAPVIANVKLYSMGCFGSGADLQEGIACFDAESGEKLWEHLYNDFLSDT